MSLSLSKNSLLYRMTAKAWGFFDIEPSPSLCGFFWQMLLSPLILFVVASVIAFAVTSILWILVYATGGFFLTVFHHFLPDSWFLEKDAFNWRFIPASLIIWFGLLGACALRVWYVYYRNEKIEEGTYKPSVTIEYIKAKKRKICPFIEFK